MKECQHCKACYADDVNTCPQDGMPTLHTIAGEPVLEGKYHLETRVGQGGMGVVYRARHAYLKTLHAIKIILPDLVGNDPQLVQRFRQEALAAAAIRHQNVVNVTDYGVAQGTMPFLVMEFVEGEDLHDYLAREKRLVPEQAFAVVSAIAKGIGAAHAQGIIHRDMKPLNIMLLKDKPNMSEAVKILDFGLAKIKSGELLGSFIQAQTTGLMGSPYYMAPEQWSDDELDARSDIYSIGVMLFQMLAGDVPFKGSSIPAIMKKHLTDKPPTFEEVGVQVPPAVEKAVRRTLEKDRSDRTETVEKLIEELGSALGLSQHGSITAQSGIPASTLQVLTSPPNCEVFVNDVPVGASQTDGWLMLEGIQSGNHNLRVHHEGYEDWQNSVFLDGSPKQVVAELKSAADADGIPKPTDETVAFNRSIAPETPQNLSITHGTQNEMQHTAHQHHQTGGIDVGSPPPRTNWFLSPIVLAIIGISGLFLLTLIGGVGAYMAGIFEPSNPTNTSPGVPTATITAETPVTVPTSKIELVTIPGGEFTMGRNDGLDRERPEHKVEVKSFLMDETEVTNQEYYQFVKETDYVVPAHYVNGKPIKGKEMQPANFVSLADALKFAEWRSKRDGVEYRLPTEEEWEYAARSGSENRLYPWGDSFESGRALIGGLSDVSNVGERKGGANKWGVQDLIGNVWEWTSTRGRAYPGSPVEVSSEAQVVRGGSFFEKPTGKDAITSTYRGLIKPDVKDKSLGFRLVRSAN